ncbi:MAG: response regulator [Thermodesulfobacteriota bacterium]
MAKKILLADDSITIQKVISITFTGEDYELEIVGDGESTVSKIKEIKPDLIIADVSMPKKNGYEICEIVKNDPNLKHIPVMLLAGTFEPLNEEEAIRVGSDDYMVKPFESQELIDKVEEIFSRPTAVQPQVGEAAFEAAPPAPETRPPAPPEVWEEGDFIGAKESAGKEVEELLEGAILEEPVKEHKAGEPLEKMEEEFMDLELGGEELKPFEEIEEIEEIKEGEAVFPEPKVEFVTPKPSVQPPEGVEGIKEGEVVFPEPEVEFVTPKPSVQPPEGVEEMEVETIREIKEEEETGPELPETPEPGFGITPEPEFGIAQEPEPVPEPEAESATAPEPVVQTTEEVTEKGKERMEETIGQRVEEKVEEALAAKAPEIPAIPKEEIEKIVTKIAKDIVEEVAWEVIPDIAEEFIKEAIKKAKEAMSSIK